MRLLAVLLSLCLPGMAAAQPLGIAFVQAPEQAQGMAMGATPEAAFAAATQRCIEGGALPEDCLPTNWCFPAGWSIDLFVQHREGLHWHEVHCGLPDRGLAITYAEFACDIGVRTDLTDCMLVQLWDPEGNSVTKW